MTMCYLLLSIFTIHPPPSTLHPQWRLCSPFFLLATKFTKFSFRGHDLNQSVMVSQSRYIYWTLGSAFLMMDIFILKSCWDFLFFCTVSLFFFFVNPIKPGRWFSQVFYSCPLNQEGLKNSFPTQTLKVVSIFLFDFSRFWCANNTHCFSIL